MANHKSKVKSRPSGQTPMWVIKAIPEGGSWVQKPTTEKEYICWDKKRAMQVLGKLRRVALHARLKGSEGGNVVFGVFELIAFSDIKAPQRDWNVKYELDDILFSKSI